MPGTVAVVGYRWTNLGPMLFLFVAFCANLLCGAYNSMTVEPAKCRSQGRGICQAALISVRCDAMCGALAVVFVEIDDGATMCW